MSKTAERWVWITRWEDFQHYPPERDRPPAWVKTYTKQLDDDRYQTLTAVQRAVLHDLRIAFSKAHGRLPKDTRKLSQRTGLRVTEPTLIALNRAGFIDFCSRPTLERRLDHLYASRARPRARGDLELPSVVRDAREGLENGDPRASEKDPPRDPDALAKIKAMADRIGNAT